MDRGSSSRPVRTVAPVVVSPDMDSNIASVTDSDRLSAKYSGAAPNDPRTVQNEATTRNPSRSRNSLRSRRTGNQQMMPAARVSPIPRNLVRLSIGVEAVEDLIEDLERALA